VLWGGDSLVGERTERGGVVWLATVVVFVETGHSTIALEGVMGLERAVGGDGLIVDTETVAVSIGVRKEAGLENGIGGGLPAWDDMRGGEGGLLDFGKVVLGLFLH
jgi:hypothetical protein